MQKQGIKTMSYGAFLLGAGIVLGAFGKHGLENKVSAREIEIFETAARYQVYNALGLLIMGLAHAWLNLKYFRLFTNLVLAGVTIFCTSLYLLGSAPLWTSGNMRFLGAITPLGGMSMIVAWVLAGFSLLKKNKSTGL